MLPALRLVLYAAAVALLGAAVYGAFMGTRDGLAWLLFVTGLVCWGVGSLRLRPSTWKRRRYAS